MKLKQAVTGMAVLACMSTAAHAQSAGTFFVSTGWFHLAPQSSSDPLTVTSIGGSPTNITEANTGATLDSADTIGFTGGYFITDHIATEFVIGVPLLSTCKARVASNSTASSGRPNSGARLCCSSTTLTRRPLRSGRISVLV